VLLYKCPPYPLHPGGSVVLGYHLTLNCKGSASPIVTFALRVCGAMLYAVAASTPPFGAELACTSKLRLFPTCRWLSCSVPASAMIKGVYSVDCVPSAPSCVASSETLYSCSIGEGGKGREGMRHVRGASLWM
jgi:hypothetical protein